MLHLYLPGRRPIWMPLCQHDSTKSSHRWSIQKLWSGCIYYLFTQLCWVTTAKYQWHATINKSFSSWVRGLHLLWSALWELICACSCNCGLLWLCKAEQLGLAGLVHKSAGCGLHEEDFSWENWCIFHLAGWPGHVLVVPAEDKIEQKCIRMIFKPGPESHILINIHWLKEVTDVNPKSRSGEIDWCFSKRVCKVTSLRV